MLCETLMEKQKEWINKNILKLKKVLSFKIRQDLFAKKKKF